MRASVIIPTCGSAWALDRTLRHLLKEVATQADIEVLVIDNNGGGSNSLRTRELCESAAPMIRYLQEPSPGATAARHRGAKEAVGEILIFIDDDVEVSAGWLRAILDTFHQSGAEIVGGPSIPRFSGSVPEWFWAYLKPNPYGGWWCGALSLLDIGHTVAGIDPIWLWTLNFSIYRKTFDTLGGFHPDLVPPGLQRWQGDGETGLTYKALASGVHCTYAHNALVHHLIQPNRLSPEYFEKRSYFQGVCDSFTRVRGGETPTPSMTGPKPIPDPPETDASPWARAAYAVQVRCAHAYNQGWAFHQREVASDPALLAWVRKANFMESDILAEVKSTGNSS